MEQTAYSPPVQRQQPEFTEPVPEPELHDLLQRSRSGDSLAFAALYAFYSGRVYDYARFNLGDEQAADDLAARIFLKAWRSIHCYDPGREPFSVWLYLVARRELLDFSHSRSDGAAVKEIVSPADEGLAAWDTDDPCSSVQ
jgi:DNA-directed RNA polymerase specialized sigma24 family protein